MNRERMPCRISSGPQEPDDYPPSRERDADEECERLREEDDDAFELREALKDIASGRVW